MTLTYLARKGFACLAAFVLGGSAAAAERTNIVLIISDDHAWTDYGFMKHPLAKTPNIDRLAGEGLCFPRGCVPTSVCCPSLATIITGKMPHVHQVTGNDPHTPPERLLAKYRDKVPSIHVARYLAMVEWFDESVGELMKMLDDRGLAKNTLVAYVADNG